MSTILVGRVASPWGAIHVAVDGTGAEPVVVASTIGTDLGETLSRVGLGTAGTVRDRDLGGVAAVVADWIDGDADAILRPAVTQPGAAFRQSAWSAMRRIPGGSVASYAELAAMAGSPRAVRAAGSACAANAVAPFVPCHRVVRTGGALGHYGYGVDVKRALLAHEAAAAGA